MLAILIAYISYQDEIDNKRKQMMPSQKLQKRVEKIKMELAKIGEMRPGSLNTQLTVCGSPGCACQDSKKPKKHGPYYQLSYVHQGKSTTQFIQKELVPIVSQQLKNYKTFKALTSEWVELALAIAKEKLALDRLRLKQKAKIQRG
jgi:hypothetical protein